MPSRGSSAAGKAAAEFDAAQWPAPEITVDAMGGTLRLTRQLGEGIKPIIMGAKNIRPSGDGAKATIMIAHDGVMLNYDTMHVMKSEERTRLGNKAFKRMGSVLGALYPDHVLHRDLDIFCMRVDGADGEMFQVEDVAGTEHKLEFFLQPYLARGAGTILFAPPGSTKSYLATLMAVSLDAGVSTLWKVPRPRRTLFVNLERSRDSVAGRLYRINKVLGLPGERPLAMINARGKTLAAVGAAISRTIMKRKIECVVLDSLSRAGGDLNDNKDANAVMDALNSYGGAWLAIGHPPRSNSEHVFGSQMFDAAADLTVQLISERRGSVTGVGLKMIKFNDIPPQDMKPLVLEFDADGLVSVTIAKPGDFAKIEAGTAGPVSLAESILSVLPSYGAGGMTVAEIYLALCEDGVTTTHDSVRVTLNARKADLFRNWKDPRGKAEVTVWGPRERN